jgi:hypothetical protein
MATLPVLTQTLDDAFTHTWYEIRDEVIDNVLDATPVWAALKNAGCMKTQVGGDFITRNIGYGEQAAVEIERGDVLPSGEPELETMAIWRWRTLASHVQRNMFDDQKNQGPAKKKDLVGTKLTAAKDGLVQKFEASMFNVAVTAETGKLIQGLNDLLPKFTDGTIASGGDHVSGTHGGIARPTAYADSGNGVYAPSAGNTFWGSKYLDGTLSTIEDELITDMKKMYNSVHQNQVAPNLIITTQAIFEIYEEFGLDAVQIVKDEGTKLVDLGFEVLRFKGKPLIWCPGITSGFMKFLNTDFIEIVYDPTYWFDMTEFKPIPSTPDRIAHIVCFLNMFTTQPRRHGQIQYA